MARPGSAVDRGIDPDFQDRLCRALGPEFEIVGLLGRGGFADVFEIRERRLDRSLAVKVLRPEIAWGARMVSRFEREARALASLNHLNIPPVHFVGDNEGLVYYVMPLIAGRSLGDMLVEDGVLEPGPLVDAMIPVLDALHHAHHLGIVHRDIKPDNIIIEDDTGRPLLVDFGVAKQIRTTGTTSSLPGVVMGTPGYISPEQAMGQEDIDARSDVYAIGATMYHLLTGTTVFPGETAQEVLGQQLSRVLPAAQDMNAAIPDWLSAILSRALAPDRADRFQTAAEMAEALRVGRRSGGFTSPPERRTVEQIREGDPTPTTQRVVGFEQPWRRRSTGERRVPRRSTARFSWPLFLGLAGALAAYFLLVPVTFTLRNNLLLPVEYSNGGGPARTISPGGSISAEVPQDGRIVGRWFVVHPASDSSVSDPAVSGVIRIERLTAAELLRRRITRSIDSWSDGNVIFTPRIGNTSSQPVRVTVGRAGGAAHCRCLVPAGTTRQLGYYRLEPTSFVRIEAGERVITIGNLESRFDLNTGLLDLSVNDTILSRSAPDPPR